MNHHGSPGRRTPPPAPTARLRAPVAVGLALALAACGGSGGKAARSGGPAPAGAPAWVARGSRVEGGSIFGVGSVSSIANVPLAQDTARNRARAEISRILEVYSASLMKDYQASTSAGSTSDEGQTVEQAIKTFSAQLMNGTEQRDMWLDPRSNTWFALVELDLERSRVAAAASARMGGGLRRWVEDNGDRVLEGLEADTGRAGSARPTAPAEAPLARAPEADASDGGPDPETGPRPRWVEGACDRAQYLCGVGEGPSATAADTRARSSLALIFQANIRAVATSFQSAAREASSRTKETWSEVERVSDHSMVSTDRIVSRSEILERWQDQGGTVWSLAVVDRARAADALEDRIRALDRAVAEELERARAAEGMGRLPLLRRALQTLGEREALDADLRVLRLDGRGIPSPVSPNDILALLDAESRQLRLGLALAGPSAEKVRACLEEALTASGHELGAVEVDERGAVAPKLDARIDARIEGVVRAASRGLVAGGQVVEATLTLRLIDARSGKTLRTFTGTEKGTRPTVDAATATAAHRVCKDRVPEMVRDLDRYFGR